MAKGDEDEVRQTQKMVDLEGKLSIWKVGIDMLREQDRNARVMSEGKFKLLENTISRDKRLESLPLVTPNKAREGEFMIISGHHRTRAARMAGLKYVYCLVDETDLSEDWVKSKQLAHNALQGYDDDQILSEIYSGIEDLQARIMSGVTGDDLLKDIPSIDIEELALEHQTQLISLVFTQKGFDDFEETIALLDGSEKILITDHKQFDEFVKVARKVSKVEDIRNVTAIFSKMMEIVKDYYVNKEKEERDKGK